MMSCNCSTCRLSTEAAQTFEEELHADDNGGDDDDDTVEQSTSLKNTAAMSMNFNYEATEQSKAKAEKEELMKSVNGQIMMDQPEMKTANTNDYCIVYTTLSLLSSIMLLYLCQ
uniref:Uncharacterized protein n=1 Tax=Setaria digitata TaxID=48799 RepID=A0A915PP81_9BILA